MRTKLRTVITLAIILNAVGLYAQKQNPRGIYHMVSITGKYGTEAAMLDQYKICTDTMTWMLSVIEDNSINIHGERTNRPYFELGDNDHMVFNYTGEEPDVTTPTMTRIFNSDKKGFSLKWWSTSRGHRVFPENGWCTEEYKSNSFSSSGKKIFDMLYSTKTKGKKDGLQGRWKVIGAIKMSGSKVVDEWLKSGKLDLGENDYVHYWDKYAIIDDQYLFTAYTDAMLKQEHPGSYGYLQEYKVSDENRQTVTVQLLTNDNTQPVKYVFYRISDDRMIVKVKHILIIDDRSDCLYDGYEIWEKTASNTPLIKLLTSTSTYKDKPKIEPRGLYRYVAGGELCRIRETRDSTIFDEKTRQWKSYIERYRLCTDTINWNVDISDFNLTINGQKLEDIQRKQIRINSHSLYDFYKPKWVLFDCSETGFSETCYIDSKYTAVRTYVKGDFNTGVWTYDKRGVTPLAKEALDVCDSKIPYDADHPLYGTWEVEGRVLNPSEAKIDSIMKGLCTDYVFHHMRNYRLFYAFTPQHRYTMKSEDSMVFMDKLDSDCKTKLVTWEQYFEQGKGATIVYLNWTLHWIDKDTLLICRDKQDLRLFVPECLVLKRKGEGESLINVIIRKEN